MTGIADSGIVDLLAHWVCRHQSLTREVNECDQELRKLRRSGVDVFADDMNDILDQMHKLKYLEAEASWWSIKLDLQVRYHINEEFTEKLEEYLDRVSIFGQQEPPPRKLNFGGEAVKLGQAHYERVVVHINRIAQPIYDTAWPPSSVERDAGWVHGVGVSRDTLNIVLVQP